MGGLPFHAGFSVSLLSQLGCRLLRIGVNKGLRVDAAHALYRAHIEGVLVA